MYIRCGAHVSFPIHRACEDVSFRTGSNRDDDDIGSALKIRLFVFKEAARLIWSNNPILCLQAAWNGGKSKNKRQCTLHWRLPDDFTRA